MPGVSRGRACCAALTVVWLLTLCGGCQSNSLPAEQEVHLKQLSVYYGQYTSAHKGQGPKNEADFKAFIKRRGSLTDDQVAELFVSPRDQQPYVVAYNVRLGAVPASQAPIVAHEATGVAGRRLTADVLGSVQEIDQTELERRALKS